MHKIIWMMSHVGRSAVEVLVEGKQREEERERKKEAYRMRGLTVNGLR
jgi:hypothetical protein